MFFLFSLLSFGSASAEVRLPNVYSDHGVLQREKPIHIWGFSAPGEKVQVDFHDQSLKTTATDQGLWEVYLRPEKAGGPYTLKVSGDSTKPALERTDILVGDIWFASGQSNMEMPLQGWDSAPIKDSAKEIRDAELPKMRLLIQSRRVAAVPQLDTENAWQVCSPETAKRFSAVAYFFGRKIMREENVPIGLIDSTWGGTPAHSWISQEGIAWAHLPSVMDDSGHIAREQGKADAIRENYTRQDEVVRASGQTPPSHARLTGDRAGAWMPSALFNGMISPFTSFTIKGWIWYQGEADTDLSRAGNYARVFPALINDWRKQWEEGPLPFLFAQLSSFEQPKNDWGCVRDAQRRALDIARTGMAVTLDIGEPHNIHPANKQQVGDRLAQAALSVAYRQNGGASPAFSQMTTEANAIRVWFTDADGLTSRGQSLDGFEIAGEDGRFVPATAKIEMIGHDSTVLVSAPSVPFPKRARYGWMSNVPAFLYNSAGLPLGTFTSENSCQ